MPASKRSRRLIFPLILLLWQTTPAWAVDPPHASTESVSDGVAALDKGDFATARRILEPLANTGNTDAQTLLGGMFLIGAGAPRNPREAARLFRLSADLGNKHGQYQLAFLLLEGVGVQRDEVEAFKYFEMSAKQGFAPAELVLGKLLNPGTFEHRGIVVGAAGPGDPQAQRISKDAVMSARYFRMAADQGNPDAQFSLGLAYEQGLGVPVNLTEAGRLFRLAAKQGHSGAQNNLGLLYSKGEGVIRSYGKAYMWTMIAAMTGNASASDNRDIMREHLTAQQREQTEQMAQRCVESQYVTCD